MQSSFSSASSGVSPASLILFLFLLPQVSTAHGQVEKHDLLEHFLRSLADGFLPLKKVERQDTLRPGQKQIQHHRGREASAKVLPFLPS